MGGTTNSQALRFPYAEEGINASNIGNFAADCATQLDVQDVNRLNVLHRPIVGVSQSSQNVAANTDTSIIWSSVDFDPNSLVNLGTFPTRITVPAAYTGLWRVTLSGLPLSTSWTKTQISVMVSSVIRSWRSYFSTEINAFCFSTMVNVPNANDFIEMRVRHTGGGTDPFGPIHCQANLAAKS